MKGIAVKLAVFLLSRSNLSIRDRTVLTGGILDKLSATPLHDIISLSGDGQLLVNGKPLDYEQARMLRESARMAIDNQANKLIDQQVLYTAITIGVHKAENEANMFFSRSAIWWEQQRERLLLMLAQGSDVIS